MPLNEADLSSVADLIIRKIISFDNQEDCPSRKELRHAYAQVAREATKSLRPHTEHLFRKLSPISSDRDAVSKESMFSVARAKEEIMRTDYCLHIAKQVARMDDKDTYDRVLFLITCGPTSEEEIAERQAIHPHLPERTRTTWPLEAPSPEAA